MAKSDLDVRIKLGIESKEYRDALRRANAEAKEFKKQQKDAFKAAGDGATSNFGKVIAMAKKVAPAVTAGLAAAIKVANDAIKENQTLTDEWARVTNSAKAVYGGFLGALNSGDFGGYLSNMDAIIASAREAADALDSLGTTEIFLGKSAAEYEVKIAQAKAAYRAPGATMEEKAAAQRTIKEVGAMEVQDAKTMANEATKAFASVLASQLTEKTGRLITGPSLVGYNKEGLLETRPGSIMDKYFKDLETYNAAVAKYKRFEDDYKKYENFQALGYVTDKETGETIGMKEYETLRAVAEDSDDNLKAAFELYIKGQRALTKVYLARASDARYMKDLEESVGAGGTTTKTAPPEGSIAHIDQQIAEWGEKLKLETEDAGRAAAQAMIDELSAQKDKMVTDAKTASIEPLSTVGLSYSLGPVAQMPTDNSGIGRADIATEKFKFTTEEVEAGMETLNTIFSETSSIISALSDTSMKANKKIAVVLSSIGSIISAVGGGPIGKLFGGVGSIIGSFDTGGIVGGTSYKGDRLTANVSSGEMILNRMQQRNLFNALQGGDGAPATATTVGVRGEDVYIALSNYMRRTNKSI